MRRRDRDGSRENKVGAASWLASSSLTYQFAIRALLSAFELRCSQSSRAVGGMAQGVAVSSSELCQCACSGCLRTTDTELLLRSCGVYTSSAAANVPAEFLQHWTSPAQQPRASPRKTSSSLSQELSL